MIAKKFIITFLILSLVKTQELECSDDVYGTVANGEKGYAGCETGYDGFRFSVCNNGVFAEPDLSHCVLRDATVFSYGVTSAQFYVSEPVNPLYLRANGIVDSFTVSPALPAGLILDTTSGEISGTPSAAAESQEYTITAMNGERVKTVTLTITVSHVMCEAYDTFPATRSGEVASSTSACPENYEGTATRTCTNGVFGALDITGCTLKAPTNLVYSPSSSTVQRNEPLTMTPTVSNVVTSWSIQPALPSGLQLTNKGSIVGVPTVTSTTRTYTVTASNAAHQTTATVTITVNPASCSGMVNLGGSQVTIDHNSVLEENCPAGYSGTASRLCTDGTYGEVTYENCRALKPTGLAYSVSSYVLDQNETMSTGRPLYGNIITAFSVEPLLPEGLSLDTTPGVISGTATELKESTSYTVTGANNDDSTTTVITIAVVLPSCQATEEFASVPVGESSTYQCNRDSYSGQMTRTCELVEGKAQWSLPDTYCQKDPNYTLLYIAIVVCVICIALLIFVIVSKKSKKSK